MALPHSRDVFTCFTTSVDRSEDASQDMTAGASLRSELAQVSSPRLALVMVFAALVNAGIFATFTFLAPIITGTAGLDTLWVSLARLAA